MVVVDTKDMELTAATPKGKTSSMSVKSSPAVLKSPTVPKSSSKSPTAKSPKKLPDVIVSEAANENVVLVETTEESRGTTESRSPESKEREESAREEVAAPEPEKEEDVADDVSEKSAGGAMLKQYGFGAGMKMYAKSLAAAQREESAQMERSKADEERAIAEVERSIAEKKAAAKKEEEEVTNAFLKSFEPVLPFSKNKKGAPTAAATKSLDGEKDRMIEILSASDGGDNACKKPTNFLESIQDFVGYFCRSTEAVCDDVHESACKHGGSSDEIETEETQKIKMEMVVEESESALKASETAKSPKEQVEGAASTAADETPAETKPEDSAEGEEPAAKTPKPWYAIW